MPNQYGNNIKLSIYGGSHDAEIGVRLSGFPAAFKVFQRLLLNVNQRRQVSVPFPDPEKFAGNCDHVGKTFPYDPPDFLL